MSNLTLDVGLANKLKVAFARNGWTEALIDKACEGNRLGSFREVLLGNATIEKVPHLIDTERSKIPFKGLIQLNVAEHVSLGRLKWNPTRPKLWLSPEQRTGKAITGEDVYTRFKYAVVNFEPLNANVLYYLLDHQHLIPQEWDGKVVHFWGTVFARPNGTKCVLYMVQEAGVWWASDVRDLAEEWTSNMPAAIY